MFSRIRLCAIVLMRLSRRAGRLVRVHVVSGRTRDREKHQHHNHHQYHVPLRIGFNVALTGSAAIMI
jgi:hypothetical protein